MKIFFSIIISGGTNEAVRMRLNQLGVKDVYLGAHQKGSILHAFSKENNISFENMFKLV